MAEEIVVRSGALEVTRGLAAELASFLHAGSALCLSGDLGAGKTSFVAGLVAALGGDEDLVLSPTFTLENRYPLPGGKGPRELVHLDLYRPGPVPDADLVGSMLEAREEGAVLAIEWAEPVRELLRPYLQLEIVLESGPGPTPPRRLRLTSVPGGWRHLEALRRRWSERAEILS